MAFGTFGIAAPAQMMAANAIPELSLANTKAATAAAKPAALPGDRIIRGDAATNPNAYREAIAKFSGNPDAKASRPATTLEATPRAVATPHSPATPYTEATSVLAPPPPLNGADPWGVAAGEAGATLGAVLGGSAGGAGAGAAGTLVAPGVGTIAGAAAGAADGAIAGAIVGAGIGYAIGTTAHDLATKMTGSAEPPSKGSGRAPEIPSGSIAESKLSGTAQKWLGGGANEVSPGRWVSNDGLRQFRFGAHETKDLQNVHAHFEAYDRPASDGGHLTENSVVKVKLNK